MTVSDTYKLEQELKTRKDLMFKMSEKILSQQEIIQKVKELLPKKIGDHGVGCICLDCIGWRELKEILKEKP